MSRVVEPVFEVERRYGLPIGTLCGFQVFSEEHLGETKCVLMDEQGNIAVIDLRSDYDIQFNFTKVFLNPKTHKKLKDHLDKSQKCGIVKVDGETKPNDSTLCGTSADVSGSGEVHREADRQTPERVDDIPLGKGRGGWCQT